MTLNVKDLKELVMGKLNKTDREWQRELSPEEFRITREKELNRHSQVSTGIQNRKGLMSAVAVVHHYFLQPLNMTAVAVGQASIVL